MYSVQCTNKYDGTGDTSELGVFHFGRFHLKFCEYLDGLKGKRVAVIGAGISNTPLIDALLAAGIDTTICDRQTRDEIGDSIKHYEELAAKLRLGKNYLDNLEADVIFRTPGLMPRSRELREATQRGAVLTSEMEAFFDVCPCKTIAVTGSDGKTTTTTIIAEILKREGRTVHIGGNIGAPLLCRADEMNPDDIAVVELSSFQLITMKKSPDIAVVTNVTPNHLDTHADIEEYIEAKRNIYVHQDKSCRAVFNFDNEAARNFAQSALGEALFFSRREKITDGVYTDGEIIFDAKNGHSEEIMPRSGILLPGVHNVENYMAAFAAVRGLAGHASMVETAREFRGVAHRIELVRELRGVKYYNDSIATSPTRTIAGLQSFDQKVILIAGGKDKGVGFDELGAEIVKRVKTLVLTGKTAGRIHDAVVKASGASGTPEIFVCEEFKDAVLKAAELAREGDIVILSPASTSFDVFKNFEERGDRFKEIVKRIEN